MITKKELNTLLTLLLMMTFSLPLWAESGALFPSITVYKSPTCGCCVGWVDHLREEGFTVITEDRDDLSSIKQSAGVPDELQSCHTALVDGYVIEGHVPAVDTKRMLSEQPAVTGLTAPGMPMKSPGMQAPGLSPKGYDVISFNKSGGQAIYNRY